MRLSLAHLEAGKAIGDPTRGGQSAEVARVERRIPFSEIDQPHLGVSRELAHCREKIMHRHSARPRARRCRELRAVNHVDVAVDRDRLAVCDMTERAVDRRVDSVVPYLAHGN